MLILITSLVEQNFSELAAELLLITFELQNYIVTFNIWLLFFIPTFRRQITVLSLFKWLAFVLIDLESYFV
jgi:hypothetical protein